MRSSQDVTTSSGSVLVEMTVALTLLTVIGLFLWEDRIELKEHLLDQLVVGRFQMFMH